MQRKGDAKAGPISALCQGLELPELSRAADSTGNNRRLGARDICFPGQELPSTPGGQKSIGIFKDHSSGPQAPSLYRGDEVIAVASMNYDPIVSKVAEVLASGRAIRKREVE